MQSLSSPRINHPVDKPSLRVRFLEAFLDIEKPYVPPYSSIEDIDPTSYTPVAIDERPPAVALYPKWLELHNVHFIVHVVLFTLSVILLAGFWSLSQLIFITLCLLSIVYGLILVLRGFFCWLIIRDYPRYSARYSKDDRYIVNHWTHTPRWQDETTATISFVVFVPHLVVTIVLFVVLGVLLSTQNQDALILVVLLTLIFQLWVTYLSYRVFRRDQKKALYCRVKNFKKKKNRNNNDDDDDNDDDNDDDDDDDNVEYGESQNGDHLDQYNQHNGQDGDVIDVSGTSTRSNASVNTSGNKKNKKNKKNNNNISPHNDPLLNNDYTSINAHIQHEQEHQGGFKVLEEFAPPPNYHQQPLLTPYTTPYVALTARTTSFAANSSGGSANNNNNNNNNHQSNSSRNDISAATYNTSNLSGYGEEEDYTAPPPAV